MTEATPRPWTLMNDAELWRWPETGRAYRIGEFNNAKDAEIAHSAVNRDHLFDELVDALQESQAVLVRVADRAVSIDNAIYKNSSVLARVAEQENAE